MEFYDMMKHWFKYDPNTGRALKEEGQKGRYSKVTLDLATAQINQMLELHGNFIGVVKSTGAGTCIIRLDDRHSAELNLKQISEIGAPFGKIFFTTDGGGGSVEIYIGGELFSRFKPISTKVGLRNIAGSDIDPAHEAGHLAGIETDTEAIKTAVEGCETDIADIKTAIEKIDDWDESDRCKVNLPKQDTAANTKISVGSSDTTVLAVSATRQFAVFVNDSDEVIYLSLSATAVMNEGIRLNASGGAYEINQNNLYTGEVSAICASGTKNLTVSHG